MNLLWMEFYKLESVAIRRGRNKLTGKVELATEQIVESSKGIFKESPDKRLGHGGTNFGFQCCKATLSLG